MKNIHKEKNKCNETQKIKQEHWNKCVQVKSHLLILKHSNFVIIVFFSLFAYICIK